MHSHPATHWIRSSELLRPSLTDLELAKNISLRSPRTIHGIVTVEETLARASLLLYHRTDPAQPNFYQQLSSDPSAAVLHKLMEASGFSLSLLDFNPASGEFFDTPDAVQQAVDAVV